MICPHCHTNVKQRERPGRKCGSCHKQFAIEPKENRLGLHDVRLMKLATALSNNGGYRFTTSQLWYAAARKSIAGAGGFPVGSVILAFVVVTILTTLGVVLDVSFLWLIAGVVMLGVVIRLAVWFARRKRRIEPPMSLREFVSGPLTQWRRVYGGDVAGLVREGEVRIDGMPPQPAFVILSPDYAALVGLSANDVPRRHNVGLAYRPDQVAPNARVVLLHDVSLDGYRFAAQARAAFGARVVADLTPKPAAVKAAKGAVRLRQPAPSAEAIGWLRASGLLTDADVDWLGQGWWSPIAALRPSALVGRVASAAQRGGDPERRAASAVGFLTWPTGRAA